MDVLVREVEIGKIFNTLVYRSKAPLPLSDEEVVLVSNMIEELLNKGWTSWEVINYLCWTEYFNTEDSEEVCLRKMSEMAKFVEKRLC